MRIPSYSALKKKTSSKTVKPSRNTHQLWSGSKIVQYKTPAQREEQATSHYQAKTA